MNALDAELLDRIISRSLDILRLSANEQRDVIVLVEKLQKDLTAKLSEGTLTDFGKARTQQLLNEANALIADYYSAMSGGLNTTLQQLAALEARHTAEAVTSVLSAAEITASLPTATVLKRLVSNVILEGSPLNDYWSKQAGDVAYRFAQQVRMGIVAGESNADIIRRIVGTKDIAGVMDISRRNVAALVQTATLTVANTARHETYMANKDIGIGEIWNSTMDNLVCVRCGSRDGRVWDWNQQPIGHDIPYAVPALHISCRCALTMKLKPITLDNGFVYEPGSWASTRASMDGQVSSKMTFEDWLNNRTPEQQDAQLGPGKAELFRQGKIGLEGMLNMKGEEMTLAQLKTKYGH